MLWEFDEQIRALVHDKDLTFEGQMHAYTMHMLSLEQQDKNQALIAHRSFLRVFKEEFITPEAALTKASPAIVFQALQALNYLTVADQRMKSKSAIEYYNQLITCLKNKTKEFLNDTKTIDLATKKYKDQKDDAWALFELLSLNITNNLDETPEDKIFADFIMAIFKKLAPTDEQIIKNRKYRAQKLQNLTNGHDDKKDNPAKNKKNMHNANGHSSVNTNIKQVPVPVLVKEILALTPGKHIVDSAQWQVFFMSLCKAMAKHLPYKNNQMEAYDLMMCDGNRVFYQQMLNEAITFVKDNKEQDKFLLVLIDKFDKSCIQCKNADFALSLPNALSDFSEISDTKWRTRANNQKIKDHFFNSIFPEDYLKKLTPKQRYDVREQFLDKLAALPFYSDRDKVIQYCADKLSPAHKPTPIVTDPDLSKQMKQLSLQIKDKVNPGQENTPWGKFIREVYTPFSMSNELWDPNVNDEEKLTRLQTMLADFRKVYSNEADRAQAQRYFISFIDSDDCKFAKGAYEYAWLFLQEMVPQSTTNGISQRDIIKSLKKELEKSKELEMPKELKKSTDLIDAQSLNNNFS